jgi:hypothetical protein
MTDANDKIPIQLDKDNAMSVGPTSVGADDECSGIKINFEQQKRISGKIREVGMSYDVNKHIESDIKLSSTDRKF